MKELRVLDRIQLSNGNIIVTSTDDKDCGYKAVVKYRTEVIYTMHSKTLGGLAARVADYVLAINVTVKEFDKK